LDGISTKELLRKRFNVRFGLKMTKEKQYIFCPNCAEPHEMTFNLRSWSWLKCDKCGEYFEIKKQKVYNASELEFA